MKQLFKTRITELLNIEYPIMQGGMRYFGVPKLAAAVSNAGGLGTITAGNYSSATKLQEAIRQIKTLTDKPFCVNVSLIPALVPPELTSSYFQTIVQEGVPIVETSGNNPVDYVPVLKEAGIKLIHKVPAVKYAQKAEAFGADIVTVIGFEGAGRPSPDEVSTMILGNKAARTLEVPIFIAGGIADGAGLVAALALGGEGIVMGTRFLATEECIIHSNFKEWIVKAAENDTVIILRSINNMMRAMKNQTTRQSLEMEKQGVSREDLLAMNSSERGKKCLEEGDTEGGVFSVGQSVGLIDRVKTIKEVMDDIIKEASIIMTRLNHRIQ